MPINGKKYSWEDISVVLPIGEAIGIDSIEYSDGQEVEATYGKGSGAIGYGVGNYSAEGKMTLLKEEADKLIAYAQKNGGSLYRLKPFPIVASYANDDQPTATDELKSCKIKKVSDSRKQGDKKTTTDIEFDILDGIFRNGVAPI